MKNNNHRNNEFARYLSGETVGAEKEAFERGLSENKDLALAFGEFKYTWLLTGSAKAENTMKTEKAWKELYRRIEEDGLAENQADIKSSFNKTRLLKIAASVALLLAILLPAYFLGLRNAGLTPGMTRFTAEINNQTLDLPDGSRVLLKKASVIIFPEDFNTNRNLRLRGEGFFNIMEDKAHPFEIRTGNANIRVLGTRFNVKEINGSGNTEVLVESGRVSVRPVKVEEDIVLTDGQFALIDRDKPVLLPNPGTNYNAWRTRVFEFQNEKLPVVLEILADAYQVDIQWPENELDSFRISTRYENQSIDAILKTISTAFNLDNRKENNAYLVGVKP